MWLRCRRIDYYHARLRLHEDRLPLVAWDGSTKSEHSAHSFGTHQILIDGVLQQLVGAALKSIFLVSGSHDE
jgi:hypothetical protein